ncbi:MAG: hypothetical protein ABIO19_02815 [Burkholderiaceae bacterium]
MTLTLPHAKNSGVKPGHVAHPQIQRKQMTASTDLQLCWRKPF